MDVTTISDLNELKALAYDQIVTIDQAQNNLKLLSNRMAELQTTTEKTEAVD